MGKWENSIWHIEMALDDIELIKREYEQEIAEKNVLIYKLEEKIKELENQLNG